MVDRSKLTAAHEAAQKAQDVVTQLENALERSSASVAQAEEALANAVAAGSAEERGRLAELKSGGNLTPLASIRRVTRFQCEEELELAQRSHTALERELAIAKNKLAAAGNARYWEAIGVTYQMCAPLVEELRTINLRRHQLRWTLSAAVNHKDEKNKPADHSELDVHNVLTDIPPNLSAPTQAMTDRWSKRIEALTTDPAAEIEVPPAITEGDAILDPAPAGASGSFIFRGYSIL